MATIDLERRAEIGRLKREKTRAALIDSSLRVVSQFGFEAPTLDDFIAAAGVARGTFYNYFQTKESLFLAMAGHVADSVDAEILQLFKGIDDPAQRIAIAIRHFIRISKRNPDWGWVLVHTLPDTSGGWSEGMRRGVLADIRRGRKLGRFKIASVEAAVALGIGTLGAAIRATLVERTSASFPNAVAAMTLQGLGMVREEAEEIATMPLPEVDRQA